MKQVKLPWFIQSPNPQVYRNGSYLTLDFETTNLENGSALNSGNRVVLAVWHPSRRRPERISGRMVSCGRYDGCIYKFAGEYELQELKLAIADVDFIIAHNAKFELQWLQRAGVDLHEILVYDTMLADKVILGNRPGSLSLASCCRRHSIMGKQRLGETLVHGGVSSEQVPESVLLSYCEQDVRATECLFLKQLEELSDEQLAVVYTRCLLTPVLADIESHGLQLDQERVEEEFNSLRQVHDELSKKLREITGGINLNSPKQVGEFLYDGLGFAEARDYRGNILRTESGGRKTDKTSISLLKGSTKKQRDFVNLFQEYNDCDSALSKYITKFKECCEDEQDKGILRAQFHQVRTQTHRLSSTGSKYKIQLQNLDRDYKRLFCGRRRGWLVGEADGAQLEFRVAAFLGQDRQAYEDIVNGVDVHANTKLILGKAGEERSRTDSKPFTFKPLYGGTSGTKAQKEYYKWFRERYSDCYSRQTGWVYDVLKRKCLVLPWGMTFYWPDTKQERSGYITNTNSIFNYPVQSLATAEIIPIAVVYFWHYLHSLKCQMFLINTVHDSLEVELPPEERELFQEIATECLTSRVYEYLDTVYHMQFNVPLGCGIKVGDHWGEGNEEIKTDVTPPWAFN